MVPCELIILESSRTSHLHLGKGRMLDRLSVSRNQLARNNDAEIQSELLHDESIAFSSDKTFPESDLRPGSGKFE